MTHDIAARVEGIAYFAMPGVADREFFRCAARAATLAVPTCARMFNDAQSATGISAERLLKCRNCSVGAAHAGRGIVQYSAFYGLGVCPRCMTGGARMIGGAICVSCYNRQREFVIGRNAKGTAPQIRLDRRRVGYAVIGPGRRPAVAELVVPLSAGTAELMVRVLSTTPGPLRFGRLPLAPLVRQLRFPL